MLSGLDVHDRSEEKIMQIQSKIKFYCNFSSAIA